MNGYFGINTNEKGTYLILKPPADGGELIRSNEIKDYLNSHGIVLDFKAVSSAILRAKEEKVVLKVSDVVYPPFDEVMTVTVSKDKLHATARFIPHSSGGRKLTCEDIAKQLKNMGIIYGIKEQTIEQLVKRKKYCTDYEIATGTLPTAGRDATIKYHFNTDNSIRPTLNEDGSVDFFHLNAINHCAENDVLAEIIPKEKGEDGYDIYGTVHPAREVADINFRYGKNVMLSDDGMRLISEVCGHVRLIDNTVFATDVYEIENVGTSTGDVEYDGNIQINGNVEDNFTVQAKGTIEIRGTVGAANIEADGDIIIANGMYGQGKGSLKAKGNVIAKFLENTTVDAGGFVEAESILHSHVSAGTDVNVEAKKGFITGGRICAVRAIKAKIIGSVMGSDTTLEVGVDAKVKDRFFELQKEMASHKKARKQDKTILENLQRKQENGEKLNSMQLDYIEQLKASINEHQEALKLLDIEMRGFAGQMSGEAKAHIDVYNVLYGGTKVTISGVSVVIKDSVKRCRLVKDGAEVKMEGLVGVNS